MSLCFKVFWNWRDILFFLKWEMAEQEIYAAQYSVSILSAEGTPQYFHRLSCTNRVDHRDIAYRCSIINYFCVCTFLYKTLWTIYSFPYFEHPEAVIQLHDGILGIKYLLNTVCICFSAFFSLIHTVTCISD